MTDIDTSCVDQLSDAIYRANGMVLGYSAAAALRDAGFVTPEDHRALLSERDALQARVEAVENDRSELRIRVDELQKINREMARDFTASLLAPVSTSPEA